MNSASRLAAGSKCSALPPPTLEAVASFENLYHAWLKAAKGRKKRAVIARFAMHWEQSLAAIARALLAGTYKPGEYRLFTVHEKKTRTIMAAPFVDRIVHHAVCNIVKPHLERAMVGNSCANRNGMGTRKGLALFGKYAHHYSYVLKCDIKKFFPTIDRAILFDQLKPKINDPGLRDLIGRILFAAPDIAGEFDYYEGDTLLAPCEHVRGLPIGNMTSQTWANWYLNRLDHFIMDYCGFGAYVRYVDDFAVFSNDKNSLAGLKAKIEQCLTRLRLKMHPLKSRVYKTTDGVSFLGFRHYRDHRVLLKPNIRRFRRRIRRAVAVGADAAQVRSSIAGWSGFALLGDTVSLRTRLCRKFEKQKEGLSEMVPRSAWGLVEQQQQRPFREPQQQQPEQQEQQLRVSCCPALE
jgi:RNA-directed DNA polymerase